MYEVEIIKDFGLVEEVVVNGVPEKVLQNQFDSYAGSFKHGRQDSGYQGKDWELEKTPMTPELSSLLSEKRRELKNLRNEVYEYSKSEFLDLEKPVYELYTEELKSLIEKYNERKEASELTNADARYWVKNNPTNLNNVIVQELLEKAGIQPTQKMSKDDLLGLLKILTKNTDYLKEIIRYMEDFDMLLSESDFIAVQEWNSEIEYTVNYDEYTDSKYCVLA